MLVKFIVISIFDKRILVILEVSTAVYSFVYLFILTFVTMIFKPNNVNNVTIEMYNLSLCFNTKT